MQKKARPTKMVIIMATPRSSLRKSGLASSTHFTTDSNPDNNHGTTCQTSKMEISGARLNNGRKLDLEPCVAPASAKATTRVRKVKVVIFRNRALARIPRQFNQVKNAVIPSPKTTCGRYTV